MADHENDAYEVTVRYRELRQLERPALAALLAGRLDPAAIRREPKSSLVQAVLTAEFGAARMADWKEGLVAATLRIVAERRAEKIRRDDQ